MILAHLASPFRSLCSTCLYCYWLDKVSNCKLWKKKFHKLNLISSLLLYILLLLGWVVFFGLLAALIDAKMGIKPHNYSFHRLLALTMRRMCVGRARRHGSTQCTARVCSRVNLLGIQAQTARWGAKTHLSRRPSTMGCELFRSSENLHFLNWILSEPPSLEKKKKPVPIMI